MTDDSTPAHTTVRLNERQSFRLEEIAVSKIEAGNRVTKSDVIREAINDYIEKFENSPQDCDPIERGSLKAIELDEGAA